MHKIASYIALAALTLTLAACGGSNDKSFVGGQSSSSSSSSSSSASTAASVTVSSSTSSIPPDNSASATITALVRDANNVAVQGVTVAFAASAGSLAVAKATTDANGQATATLTASGAAVGTAITVTVTAGSATGKTTVNVVNNQQTISLLTSSPQMPSDNSAPATITALVRDANNRVLPGVAVSFQADSGAIAAVQTTAGAAANVPAGTTDANGQAQATLSTPGDATNRTITVTATLAGTSTSATVTVAVIGTTLTVTGPSNLVKGSQGTYTVALKDSKGTGIPNQTITLASANGNTLSAATVTTDNTGQKTFQLTATNAGNDTITATGLGLSASEAVNVTGQSFAFTTPATSVQVNLNTSQSLVVNWSNNGTAQVGQTVTFSSTRGTLSAATAVTDASGNASVTISSTTAGPAVISATGTGVTAQATIDFIATNPTSIAVQSSPATIQTGAQSTITATVRDPNNNLVEGAQVDFTITQDPTGGSLSVASATTNAQGQASTVYTASSTTSAKDGVVITANVATTSVTGTTSLTVGGQTVFLSLGTGNSIVALNSTQYQLPYSVQAIDSAGAGVNNVPITLTVTSMGYGKGAMVWDGTSWVPGDPNTNPPTAGTFTTSAADAHDYTLFGYNGCSSEDVNNNGILDPGEDYNNDTKLEPGLVAATDVSSGTTANGGSLSFNLIYPKDHAYWVAVQLTATATVNGTQSSTSATFWLPGLNTDYNSQNKAPPGPNSPYGQANTCASPN